MLKRSLIFMMQSCFVLGLAVSLAACSHFDKDDAEEVTEEIQEEAAEAAEEAEAAAEEAEEAAEGLQVEEAACPHGGGACCEHDKPHPCCAHTMKEDSGAESQPATQPAE